MNRISFFNIIQEIFLMRGISLIDHFPHTSCFSFWLSQTAAQSASADLFGLVYNNTLTMVWYGWKKANMFSAPKKFLSAKYSWFTCWNHWTLSAICASSISSLSANFLGCDGFLPLLYTLVLCIITMLVLASSWVRDDWQLIFVCVSTPT